MRAENYYIQAEAPVIPIIAVIERHFEQWLSAQAPALRQWLRNNQFVARSGQYCLYADEQGEIACVYLGLSDESDEQAWAQLAEGLPAGDYKPQCLLSIEQALSWALGQYRFTRYRKQDAIIKRLALSEELYAEAVHAAQSIFLVRDLINTPTNDMTPNDLAACMKQLAATHGGQFKAISATQLLTEGFPAIHAVGRASEHQPQLLELRWGNAEHPWVSLVGKGVCFDSGGLDIKPSQGMRLMKKDMGGAAHAIGLAHWIMSQGLPIQIQVLVPAVENAISGNAYRPGDIIETRKGLSVEIGNTDAEGRLVLADALTYASENKPDLIIDFATLTGAARVALGTEIGAMFCNDDVLARDLSEASEQTGDALWRLPLHQAYLGMIKPKLANLSNAATGGYAGAITAALFLEQFIEADIPWVHLDIMAWNLSAKPGKPEGGEALGLRAVYRYLVKKYRV